MKTILVTGNFAGKIQGFFLCVCEIGSSGAASGYRRSLFNALRHSDDRLTEGLQPSRRPPTHLSGKNELLEKLNDVWMLAGVFRAQ